MKRLVLMIISTSICGVVFMFCLIAVSCKNTKKEILIENNDRIDKVLIQFFPSFIEPSLMLLDLSKWQHTFQRFGLKKYYQAIPPRDIIQIHAPKSLNFQIDTLSYSYLRDISFDEEDFMDKEVICDDGIFHTILYVFKSGRIEDIDLKNAMTENEYKLIVRLIDMSIDQSTDSITTKYLKELRKYHHERKIVNE